MATTFGYFEYMSLFGVSMKIKAINDKDMMTIPLSEIPSVKAQQTYIGGKLQ